MKKIKQTRKFIDNCILKLGYLKKKKRKLYKKDKAMKVWSRRSTIEPYFVNCWVKIHNGNDFVLKKITKEMIGYKFGQFSFTRSKYVYKKKKKK